MTELSDSIRQTLISCEVKAGDIGLVTQIFDDLLAVAEAAQGLKEYWGVHSGSPHLQALFDAVDDLKVRS